jgi:MFS family permease
MEELARHFPSGLRYEIALDRTEFVRAAIDEVVKTLFEAILLVVVVTFVFLQNWRATLIPCITIPVALVGTFAPMAALGFSFNTLSLLGLVLAVGLLFSAFAASLVAARLFLGHVPDKLGGARVALVSVVVEATGLALIWLVPTQVVAAVGASLTGLGFALVYPGLGVEAVRRAPPQSRGLAMGAYTAFLDVALGFGSPALGLVAGWGVLGTVFLASALVVLGAAGVAVHLLRDDQRRNPVEEPTG